MDDNIVDYLVDLGFTGYEAKVYSSLVTLGRTTATLISNRAGVPRARIYDILGTLERKGWIKSIKTKPIQFVSISFEEAQKNLSKLEENFKKTKKIITDELKLSKVLDKEKSKEDQIIFVKTEETIEIIKEVLNQTTKSLNFFRINSQTVMLFIKELKKLKRKKVNIKIILKDKPTQKILYEIMAVGEVKFYLSKDIINGSLFVDKKLVMNIFEQKGELYATKLTYKKCLYCLDAWLTREWSED